MEFRHKSLLKISGVHCTNNARTPLSSKEVCAKKGGGFFFLEIRLVDHFRCEWNSLLVKGVYFLALEQMSIHKTTLYYYSWWQQLRKGG